MKQNKSNILLIVVFIMMITLPQVVSWAINEKQQEISTSENRKLNSKPTLELATITEYPTKFDNYYNDHLPFRSALRGLWTSMNYDLFNTTIDSRVLVGKEGWLFYRGDQAIEQIQGTVKFKEIKKAHILNTLKETKEKLEKKGIETYVLILPSKGNVYKEYLPNEIPIKSDISRTEELIEYIRENLNINVIYPKQELIKAKDKYQVYRKYDTHWNKIGACIGTISLQKEIDNTFDFDIDDIQIEIRKNAETNKDLARFAGLNNRLHEDMYVVNNFLNDVEYQVNKEQIYEEFISNANDDRTVLLVGDSFRENMRDFFPKLYKKVVFVHRDSYQKEMIDRIQPDIVIIEAVERLSDAIDMPLY